MSKVRWALATKPIDSILKKGRLNKSKWPINIVVSRHFQDIHRIRGSKYEFSNFGKVLALGKYIYVFNRKHLSTIPN